MCERKVALGLLGVVPWLTQGPGSVARAQCPIGPFDVISPNAMAIADLNQDGHEDCVVVASGSANNVRVLAGDGAGGFCPGPPVLVFESEDDDGYSASVVDFIALADRSDEDLQRLLDEGRASS